jgi:hypothetical protein
VMSQWPDSPTKWGTGVVVLKRYPRAPACVLFITIKMNRLVCTSGDPPDFMFQR